MFHTFLTGNHKDSKGNKRGETLPKDSEYPEDCFVHIDFRLIDIFKKMSEQTKKIEDKVIEEFYRIKDDFTALSIKTRVVHLYG